MVFMGTPPVLKIVIAGDENVGKTSLIRQYCQGRFMASREETVDYHFRTKSISLPEGQVKLSIWEMAKHSLPSRGTFYTGSLAAALVFDVTSYVSLSNLEGWAHEISDVVPEQRFIIVGNKCDLERAHWLCEAQAFAASLRARYIETSALTAVGVTPLFNTLALLASAHLANKNFHRLPQEARLLEIPSYWD
jgi:small GTP-binding protein